MKLSTVIIGIFLAIIIATSYGCLFRFKKVDLPDRTLVEKVYVDRKGNGDYLFQFTTQDTLTIYQGYAVETIDWERPVKTVAQSSIVLENYNFAKRFFFGFENTKGERFIASERLIPMENAANFRDLGGIPTKDGRVVKWGKIYRSGKLNSLSDKDLDYFNTLGINTVIDFRDDIEVAKDKTRFPTNREVKRVRTPIGDRSGNMQAQLKKQVRQADQDTFDSEKFVADVMRQFVDTFAYQYQPFLDLIAEEENAPLLYHCTAGKDRTGLGTALVLAMLGVEEEIIYGDFMMSNYYRNEQINKTLRKSSLVIKQRVVQPLVEVKESYIKTAFDAIDEKYGSMDNFLEKEYGYDAEKLDVIRKKYLMYNDDNVEPLEKPAVKK
jgi:protein-tyrosine phosphatase